MEEHKYSRFLTRALSASDCDKTLFRRPRHWTAPREVILGMACHGSFSFGSEFWGVPHPNRVGREREILNNSILTGVFLQHPGNEPEGLINQTFFFSCLESLLVNSVWQMINMPAYLEMPVWIFPWKTYWIISVANESCNGTFNHHVLGFCTRDWLLSLIM
jgi:hypothetical protein